MKRRVSWSVPDPDGRENKSGLSRLHVDQDVADDVRRIARVEKRQLGQVLADALDAYVEKNHPDWLFKSKRRQ